MVEAIYSSGWQNRLGVEVNSRRYDSVSKNCFMLEVELELELELE